MREFIQKNLLKSKRSMKWERNLTEKDKTPNDMIKLQKSQR
jgi:hypothetical protein